nr:unnamed protein product [Spirometra erinaceieuropaei]
MFLVACRSNDKTCFVLTFTIVGSVSAAAATAAATSAVTATAAATIATTSIIILLHILPPTPPPPPPPPPPLITIIISIPRTNRISIQLKVDSLDIKILIPSILSTVYSSAIFTKSFPSISCSSIIFPHLMNVMVLGFLCNEEE